MPDGSERISNFKTTGDHPWRTTNNQWVETSQLGNGVLVQVAYGASARVISIVNTEKTEPTYNLEIADFHTYFVGEDRIWVHNACSLKPLSGPIADFRRMLAASGKTPKWMNQWLQVGRSPPGHEVDHLVAQSIGGGDKAANLRLKTIADHRNRHKFYRPWLR